MKEVVDFEASLAQGAVWHEPRRSAMSSAAPSATAFPMRNSPRAGASDEIAVREPPQRARRARRLQPRGYLRGGVRKLHARTCIPTTKAPARPIPCDRKKVMILGSGPNRIGQGIEFDYCCCHASFALQEMGVESIMVNCNPETVSTDYDTSDRLYFEPLTLENVLNICDTEKPDGVIVQFGGQTPLNLALPLKRLGVPIIGTDPANIDLAEDRKLFGKLLDELAHSRARQRHRHQRRRGLRGGARASAIRCWCGPATCWAGAPW